MGRHTRKPPNPPAWYPLDAYAAQLDMRQWVEQIHIRLSLQEDIDAGFLSLDEAVQVFVAEIVNFDRNKFIWPDVGDLAPVRVATVGDVVRLYSQLRLHPELGPKLEAAEWERQTAAVRWKRTGEGAALSQFFDGLRAQFPMLYGEGLIIDEAAPRITRSLRVTDSHRLLCLLDLDSNKFELANETEKLVTRERKQQKLKSDYTPKDLAKWRSYKILAYYDLKLWARISKKRPTNQNLVELLFPRGPYNVDDLRKTIRPNVALVMHRTCVHRLVLQVLQISHKPSKKRKKF